MRLIKSSIKLATRCEWMTASVHAPRWLPTLSPGRILCLRLNLCLVLGLCIAAPCLSPARAEEGGPPTDVLRMELEEARSRVTALSNTPGTGTETEQHRAALAEARRKFTLMQERNSSFISREDRGGFIAYAYSQQIGVEHIRLAEHYYSVFRQLFPDFRFTQRNPVHFIIYPNRDAYLKYEDIPQWAGGHAMTRRIVLLKLSYTDRGYLPEPDPRHKLLRLAINSDRDFAGRSNFLGHELTHIFVWELLNVDDKQYTSINGNRFLNEGIAEYIGLYNLAQLQSERLSALAQVKDPAGPLTWLDFNGYPAERARIDEYYAEAYLFVRWLATIDRKAGERLRAVLPAQTLAEFKAKLAEFERNEPLYKINLNDYPAYRKRILATAPPK